MHRTLRTALATVLLCFLAGSFFVPPLAQAQTGPQAHTGAPTQTGPPLTTAPSARAKSLVCSAGVDEAKRAPVLLVHGTRVTAKENWGLVYLPSLTRMEIPWCYVSLPQRATGDIQLSAEYVVHAIRTMYARAHRQISIIGASQGGMLPRWALRFWPDLRLMVDDVIALAPTNHGSDANRQTCAGEPCLPAVWQQSSDSEFIRALNSGPETFPGISYTNVYSHTDTTVTPNQDDSGTSSLHGGGGEITNVAVQDVCPTSRASHITLGLLDKVAFSLARDALTHPGPADVGTVKALGCDQPRPPGFNPVPLLLSAPQLIVSNLLGVGFATKTQQEPPLRCYAGGTC